jgi:hypothetical protein
MDHVAESSRCIERDTPPAKHVLSFLSGGKIADSFFPFFKRRKGIFGQTSSVFSLFASFFRAEETKALRKVYRLLSTFFEPG